MDILNNEILIVNLYVEKGETEMDTLLPSLSNSCYCPISNTFCVMSL